MKISRIVSRSVYDCCGLPTVACDIFLDDGSHVTAVAPSGTSVGSFELPELRDGGQQLRGLGVKKTIKAIEENLKPLLEGKNIDALAMDAQLAALAQSSDSKAIGGNGLIAVSMALYRAHAHSLSIELFHFIHSVLGFENFSIPMPLINVINGGSHTADGVCPVQEFLIIPVGGKNLTERIVATADVCCALEDLFKEKKYSRVRGLEGGFVAPCAHVRENIVVIQEAIARAGYDKHFFAFGLDVAATQFFDSEQKTYLWQGQKITTKQLVAKYAELLDEFPIIYLEDGLAEDDWDGWSYLNDALSSRDIFIVGDDLTASSMERVAYAIKHKAINSVILKPNQVGTVYGLFETVSLCKEFDVTMISSHRSRETEDTFIVDFAVGATSRFIKLGGMYHSERLAKYNRLLFIERLFAQL
jgi:enolase